jgi:hypothetical protein
VANTSIESGFHSVQSEVDSILEFQTTFLHTGSIQFTYTLTSLKTADMATDESLAGVQFFLDGVPQDRSVVYHPEENRENKASFPLAPGEHTFHWVFHQPLGTNRQKKLVLSDIVVVGSNASAAGVTIVCERGTFSTAGSPSMCELCPPGTESGQNASSCTKCKGNSIAENWGTAQCDSCANSIHALPDHTACDTNGCVFSSAELNLRFNLSSLNYLVTVRDQASSTAFKLSICDKLSQSAQCFDKNNKPVPNAHVCTVDMTNGVGKDSGHILNPFFDDISVEGKTGNPSRGGHPKQEREYQFRLSFTRGSPCGPAGSTQQRTDVIFECDPEITEKTFPTLVSAQSCVISMNWRHIASCRLCDETADYEEQLGECVRGTQEVVKIRHSKCNGPMVLSKHTQSCSRTLPISIPAAMLLILLFFGLVVAMMIFIIRNKRMSERYEMLVNSTRVNTSSSDGEVSNTDTA